MENKRKSILISVFIAVFFIILTVGYCAFFIAVPVLWFRVIGLIVLGGFTFVMIFVLRERIKEIKKGEMDDLSKY